MIFNYIYTTFLTIIYTLVMSFSLSYYLKERKKSYLLIALYFLLLILNGMLVTMSENFKTFASDYNEQFMINPIIETLYYLAIFAIVLKLISNLNKGKLKYHQYGIYIIFALWLIIIPFLSNSAIKVWLYYLPSQLFTIYLGIYLLRIYSRIDQTIKWHIYIKILGVSAIFFGLAILSEDTFVIFFRDVYHIDLLKIHNRNISEDFFHLSLCIFTIQYFVSRYFNIESNDVTHSLNLDSENLLNNQEGNSDFLTREYLYFRKFTEEYGITQREAEILDLLIKHKHNQEIANQLYLSLGTVKTHTHNIFIKLQVKRRSEVCEVWKNFEHIQRLNNKE